MKLLSFGIAVVSLGGVSLVCPSAHAQSFTLKRTPASAATVYTYAF